ncbi:hypothetical protein IWW55_004507 [Coemansia sp. RSA 2706]|nr:hypothetical protein IWW55_004507 [Coemansia sp. RSA 2706]KAJ2309740.1 hypothetical protein IWW54_003577 [Coemansia sp. RSA 2705]KAJ2322922.1 hypothetical protein IWW51_003999 [Coemansia sp. RSA 2702]
MNALCRAPRLCRVARRWGYHAARPVHSKQPPNTLLPGQFLVGPPHTISNIRPVKFHVPADETAAERQYRELREHAAQRDHEFWLDNNTRFEQGKQDFERRMLDEAGECTADDLARYFKQYQEESYGRHLAYNRSVWRRNVQMVWPGVKAWAQEVRRRGRRRTAALARHAEQGYFFDAHAPGPERPRADKAKDKDEVDRRAEKIRSYY